MHPSASTAFGVSASALEIKQENPAPRKIALQRVVLDTAVEFATRPFL